MNPGKELERVGGIKESRGESSGWRSGGNSESSFGGIEGFSGGSSGGGLGHGVERVGNWGGDSVCGSMGCWESKYVVEW